MRNEKSLKMINFCNLRLWKHIPESNTIILNAVSGIRRQLTWLRSQVQYVAASSPSPTSTTMLISSSERISLARSSSMINGSPACNKCRGVESLRAGLGMKLTDTNDGFNGWLSVWIDPADARIRPQLNYKSAISSSA